VNASETSGIWCLGPSTGGASVEVRGFRLRKNFEVVYSKSCNIALFGSKMVGSAVHNASVNTLTMGTPFLCVSPRNDPGLEARGTKADGR